MRAAKHRPLCWLLITATSADDGAEQRNLTVGCYETAHDRSLIADIQLRFHDSEPLSLLL
jgi:hypothetical protein